MAVVSAPLLSFTAKGQIAKTQVYANWKGRPYVRRLVIPSNPRSTEQTKTRNTFTFLNNVWKTAPADFIAPWTLFAKGKVMTNRNAWLQKNIANLRDQITLAGIVLSPGAAGGLTVTPTFTPGSGTLTAELTEPSPLPSGWTIVEAVVAAILDQDPTTDETYTMHTANDVSTPFAPQITGLAAGDYMAGAWFVYQRSSNVTDLAYGAAIGATVTVT